ncbi:hypothetical protein H045_20480 [Pseudomonas poae RE*1-1-14]|nr:hypothetical protein H045_20480 [Pseudomonas poae RE*1-1-14]
MGTPTGLDALFLWRLMSVLMNALDKYLVFLATPWIVQQVLGCDSDISWDQGDLVKNLVAFADLEVKRIVALIQIQLDFEFFRC